MARPELKLAGMRIDPEIFARSKMGYSLDMAIVEADQVGAWFYLGSSLDMAIQAADNQCSGLFSAVLFHIIYTYARSEVSSLLPAHLPCKNTPNLPVGGSCPRG